MKRKFESPKIEKCEFAVAARLSGTGNGNGTGGGTVKNPGQPYQGYCSLMPGQGNNCAGEN